MLHSKQFLVYQFAEYTKGWFSQVTELESESELEESEHFHFF